MPKLYSKVKIDDRLFVPVQVHKLIAYMRDKHGFGFLISTTPKCGINSWSCSVLCHFDSARLGASMWECVARAVVDICIPAIDQERKGGNG